jgi:quercetin dioxygenase-like cupin family protein
MMKLAVAVALLGCLAVASAQPFAFNGTFAPRIGEIDQRRAVNYTGFVFDFKTAKKTDGGTPNASLRSNQVSQNPFQSTLPGDGNGQTLVTMGPCSGNTVHTHPRGSEISFVTYGQIQFGMVEENSPVGNPAVVRMISAGETIHIPTGIQHFSHNPTCGHAQFLANFATADPGTQTVWNSFVKVPLAILHMSTGIPESQLAELTSLPLVVAPGTGGEECLARCGLNFTTANAFEPEGAR